MLSVRATLADLDVLVALNEVVQKLHAALEPGNFKPVIDTTGKSEMKRRSARRMVASTFIISPLNPMRVAQE